MSPSARPVSPEELLAHAEWVRRLARSLVAGDERADDVAQETWLQALRAPPRDASNLRGWLACVAQNVARKLARGEQRRARREASSAPPTALPTPAESYERAALQRRVVDAVLALDEPYRSALLLRFLEELAPADVARALGVPLETARTRIKRGLALVRERLRGELGADRHGWIAALAPLLVPRGAGGGAAIGSSLAASAAATTAGIGVAGVAGVVIGGALVSKTAKLAIGAAVVVAALAWPARRWLAPPAVAPLPEAAAAREAEAAELGQAPAADVAPAPLEATREERVAETRPGAPASAPSAAVAGRVVDEAGAPVAGAIVVLGRTGPAGVPGMADLRAFRSSARHLVELASEPPAGVDGTGAPGGAEGSAASLRKAVSAGDGTFRFDAVEPQQRCAVAAWHDPLGLGWSDAISFEQDATLAQLEVVLEAGVVLFGTVSDPHGRPLAGAAVNLAGSLQPPGDRAPGFTWSELMDGVNVAADGSWRSLPLPWRHVALHVLVRDRADLAQLDVAWEELPPGAREVRRDLVVPALGMLSGRIVGPDGRPARLRDTVAPRLGDDARRVQSAETIAVVALRDDPRARPELLERLGRNVPGLVYLDAGHVYGTLALEDDRYQVELRHQGLRFVAVVARGELLGVAEVPEPLAPVDVAIDPARVPERALVHALRVRLFDGRDGTPLEGVAIHAIATSTTRSGAATMSVLHFGPPQPLDPERELLLPFAPCTIEMRREGFAVRAFAIDPTLPGAPRELDVGFHPAGGPLEVAVAAPDGTPVAGAWLRVYSGRDGEPLLPDEDRTTDEHGRATLTGLPEGPLTVVAEAREGFAPGVGRSEAAPAEEGAFETSGSPPVARRVAIVLEPGYDVRFDARLADGRTVERATLRLLDEEGVALYDAAHPRMGGQRRFTGRGVRLVDGSYTVELRALGPVDAAGREEFVAAPGLEVQVGLTPIGR